MNHIFKVAFWNSLTDIGNTLEGPWCLAWDFNALLEQRDKLEGHPFTFESECKFKKLVDDMGLLDLGFIGYPFTWNNHRVGRANIQERLDRAFSNTDWRLLFLQTTLHHLPP